MAIGQIGFLQQNPLEKLTGGFATGFDLSQGVMDQARANDARQMFGQAAQTGEINPLLAAANPALFQAAQANQFELQDREAQAQANQLEIDETERQRMIDDVARDAKSALDISDPALRNQFLGNRAQKIAQAGGDPSDTLSLMEMTFDQQTAELNDALNQALPMSSLGRQQTTDSPASVKETEWFLRQTPEVQKQHLEVKRKSDPTLAAKLEQAQSLSDIKVDEAGRKEGETGKAKRIQGFIDSGIEAADSLSNVVRVSELLDSVETGGFDNIALRAKQLFGVESADEAELSAGLGKAILSQLKPIFGAAFTAAEGERLERIEANFGKSTEGNKRLINEVKRITERAARRGLKAAESQGDEFTAEEIRGLLDGLKSKPKEDVKPLVENVGRFQIEVE